jgi:hypothetical protein
VPTYGVAGKMAALSYNPDCSVEGGGAHLWRGRKDGRLVV